MSVLSAWTYGTTWVGDWYPGTSKERIGSTETGGYGGGKTPCGHCKLNPVLCTRILATDPSPQPLFDKSCFMVVVRIPIEISTRVWWLRGVLKASWPPVPFTDFLPALSVVMISLDRPNGREIELGIFWLSVISVVPHQVLFIYLVSHSQVNW